VATLFVVASLTGVGLGSRGTPRRLRPRPLYASGLSWGLSTVGLGCLTVAVGLFAATENGSVPAATSRITVPLLFGGVALAGLGWVVRLMARNAEARARLDASSEVVAWRARPAPGRRRWLYGLAAVSTVGILVAVAWLREPSILSMLGASISLAARGANEHHFWLGDETLVYGNPQARYLVDAADVTRMRRRGGGLSIERRGWRPALTVDTSDLDDPVAIETALTRAL
jgi:hypothetical protein